MQSGSTTPGRPCKMTARLILGAGSTGQILSAGLLFLRDCLLAERELKQAYQALIAAKD